MGRGMVEWRRDGGWRGIWAVEKILNMEGEEQKMLKVEGENGKGWIEKGWMR